MGFPSENEQTLRRNVTQGRSWFGVQDEDWGGVVRPDHPWRFTADTVRSGGAGWGPRGGVSHGFSRAGERIRSRKPAKHVDGTGAAEDAEHRSDCARRPRQDNPRGQADRGVRHGRRVRAPGIPCIISQLSPSTSATPSTLTLNECHTLNPHP